MKRRTLALLLLLLILATTVGAEEYRGGPDDLVKITVMGQVNNPGYYQLQTGAKLMDAIGLAGGASGLADITGVTIIRPLPADGSEVLRADLKLLLQFGDVSQNHVLQGGDIIFVPEMKKVLLLGEFRRPGAFYASEGSKVLDLIAEAGGLTEAADSEGVVVTTTDGSQLTFDLDELSRSPLQPANLSLKGGEVIFAPARLRRVLGQVVVLGEVERPGTYQFRKGETIVEALAYAGGAEPSADLAAVTVARRNAAGSENILVDLTEINRTLPLPLENGDVVFVPATRSVLVLGKVARPGSYVLPYGSRVLDAIAAAGGLAEGADEGAITLSQSDEEREVIYSIDYKAIVSARSAQNRVLAGGDILFVPETEKELLLLGEVKSPGLYPLRKGMGLLEAIAMAGGPTERAALQSVGIYRDGRLVDPATYSMGKERLLFQGDVSENPTVLAGDVIYLPETKRPNWTEIFSFVSGIKLFKDLLGWK